MKIVSGNSNINLAHEICSELNIKLTDISVKYFQDREIYVEFAEDLMGENIFLIQSISNPVNDNLMELLIIIDALKRSNAKNIIAVIPYLAYTRQDRKKGLRNHISAKLVADMIKAAGANHIITIDIHNTQIEGFFNIPITNISISSLIDDHLKVNPNSVIVSPDIGGTSRAKEVALAKNLPLIIIDKNKGGGLEEVNIIGDAREKDCIIIDDIVNSAYTINKASEILSRYKAKSINAYVTHGVLSSGSLDIIASSNIEKLVITNSINNKDLVSNIEVISIASLIAESIKKIEKYS